MPSSCCVSNGGSSGGDSDGELELGFLEEGWLGVKACLVMAGVDQFPILFKLLAEGCDGGLVLLAQPENRHHPCPCPQQLLIQLLALHRQPPLIVCT